MVTSLNNRGAAREAGYQFVQYLAAKPRRLAVSLSTASRLVHSRRELSSPRPLPTWRRLSLALLQCLVLVRHLRALKLLPLSH